MQPYIPEAPVQIFLSSAIDEFTEERKLLHERINIREELLGFKVWIFEHVAGQAGDTDGIYLDAVKASQLFALILGRDLREPVLRELRAARAEHKRILVFPHKVERTPECEELLRELTPHGIYRQWSTSEDLWIEIRAAADLLTRRAVPEFLCEKPTLVIMAEADAHEEAKSLADEVTSLCDQDLFDEALRTLYERRGSASASFLLEVENLIAFVFRRQGKCDVALAGYRSLFQSSGNARFEVNTVFTLLVAGRVEEAKQALTSLSPAALDLPQVPIIRAQLLYDEQRYLDALRSLMAVRVRSKRRKNGPDFLNLFGHIAAELGHHRTASRSLLRVCRSRPLVAPTTIPYAAYYLLHAGIQSDNTNLISQALERLDSTPPPESASLLGRGQSLQSFLQFRALTRGAILHALGRTAEARHYLQSLDPTLQEDPLIRYNIEILNYVLEGILPSEEVTLEAARRSKNTAIWANMLNRRIAEASHTKAVDEELLLLTEEFDSTFPDSAESSYFKAAIRSIEEPYPAGLEDLRAAYRNSNLATALRINALLASFTHHANANARARAEAVLHDAIDLKLLCINMLAEGMKLARKGTGDPSYSICRETLHLANYLPAAMSTEQRCFGIIPDRKVYEIGALVGAAASGAGRLQELLGQIEEMEQTLPEDKRSAFNNGLSSALRC